MSDVCPSALHAQSKLQILRAAFCTLKIILPPDYFMANLILKVNEFVRLKLKLVFWLFSFTMICITFAQTTSLVFRDYSDDRPFQWDFTDRHFELRFWESGVYPSATLQQAEVVQVVPTTYYPPTAIPVMWLVSPSDSLEINGRIMLLVSVAAAIITAALVFRHFSSLPLPFRAAASTSILAVNANYATVAAGQYGLLLNLLFILIALSLRGGRPLLASVMYFFSLIKPTSSLLLGIFIYRSKAGLRGVAVVLGLLSLALISSSYVANVDFLNLAIHWLTVDGRTVSGSGNSIITGLIRFGLDPMFFSIAAAFAAGAAMYLFVGRYARSVDVVDALAVAGVLSRVFFYHHFYDNLLVVFLMPALIRLLANSFSMSTLIVFLSVALSLTAPTFLLSDSVREIGLGSPSAMSDDIPSASISLNFLVSLMYSSIWLIGVFVLIKKGLTTQDDK
jgi:hypothetical protein